MVSACVGPSAVWQRREGGSRGWSPPPWPPWPHQAQDARPDQETPRGPGAQGLTYKDIPGAQDHLHCPLRWPSSSRQGTCTAGAASPPPSAFAATLGTVPGAGSHRHLTNLESPQPSPRVWGHGESEHVQPTQEATGAWALGWLSGPRPRPRSASCHHSCALGALVSPPDTGVELMSAS